MAFFDRNRSSHGGDTVIKAEDDSRHPDGKFKMGPANSQRKMGDMAFQAAKDHIDSAASAAKGGDEGSADFHVGMAQQYAALGCKNHLMGNYAEQTKGKAPMPVLQQQQMKKAEDDLRQLAKSDHLVKNWDAWNEAHHGEGATDAAPGGDPHRMAANTAASSVMSRMTGNGQPYKERDTMTQYIGGMSKDGFSSRHNLIVNHDQGTFSYKDKDTGKTVAGASHEIEKKLGPIADKMAGARQASANKVSALHDQAVTDHHAYENVARDPNSTKDQRNATYEKHQSSQKALSQASAKHYSQFGQ